MVNEKINRQPRKRKSFPSNTNEKLVFTSNGQSSQLVPYNAKVSRQRHTFILPSNCRVFNLPTPTFERTSSTTSQRSKVTTRIGQGSKSSRNPFVGISTEYHDIGDPFFICTNCNARLWPDEAKTGNKQLKKTIYSLCCYNGKVQLPNLIPPPPSLLQLYTKKDVRSKNFIQNIRRYNMMYSFTSMGGKIDHKINNGSGPYCFRMHGQNYHTAGSLLPQEGQIPRFAQLYIYDTDHEEANRINAYSYSRDHNVDSPFSLNMDTVNELKHLLDAVNPLVIQFRMARDRYNMNEDDNVSIKLINRRDTDGRTHNLPTANEVAALIIGDIDGSWDKRDIILQKQTREFKRISELHPQYLALQYPLLFPYSEDGYRADILHKGIQSDGRPGRIKLTMREFFAYKIQMRLDEVSLILLSRKLFQQFLVDGFTMVENSRITYIRNNQKTLRITQLDNLSKAAHRGTYDVSEMGNRFVMPSSFTGGLRYMQQNYLDAMALCKRFGHPDLFITLTCNPKWPEILRILNEDDLSPEDRPDILTRVFKIKLDNLVEQLRDEKPFGLVLGVVYTIEFQKRGLPHCHLCLFLDKAHKLNTSSAIDSVICAEIPDKEHDPDLYQIVSDFMMHGPCGRLHPKCPCMKKGRCSKHFPKEFSDHTYVDDAGYPKYKRPNNGRTVKKGGADLDNRHVVAYNSKLMKQYQGHMNIELCNQLGSIKYLFKYINKGPDRITVGFRRNQTNDNDGRKQKNLNELEDYYNCRYISACEAAWRIFSFDIVYRFPSVERLSFHLPNRQPIVYDGYDNIDDVLNKPSVGTSQFLEWMECNKTEELARTLTYIQFPTEYVWNIGKRKWAKRIKQKPIGRINYISPKAGEAYFLRILLNKVVGPTCYEDIRTVGDKVYNTFKEACFALGLLDDDREYIESIKETHAWASASFCRQLFVSLITSDSMARPDHVWKETRHLLSDDILHERRQNLRHRGIETDVDLDVVYNMTLARIQKLLQSAGTSLENIPNMPLPDYEYIEEACNMLINDELNYDLTTVSHEHDQLYSSLNTEQKNVYETVMTAVEKDEGGVFFIYGYGGTGKTHLWKTLSVAIRSKREIVINVASSGIAALLLPGGRTAHSRFCIPINPNEDSFCNISPDSNLAALLNKTKLIIWDEAPMTHKHCFEAFDRTMKDIIRTEHASKPFGGKVVIFGGDFRQILPVVTGGTRPEIVNASLHISYLWTHCKVLRLTVNMRLRNGCSTPEQVAETKEFADWIIKIGEGNIGQDNDGEADVVFPSNMLINTTGNHVKSVVDVIYPNIRQHIKDPTFFQDKAILVRRNDEVDLINDYVLSLIDAEERTYLSSDTLCEIEQDEDFEKALYSPEILNGFKSGGIPNHVLTLKEGVPIMLLRNVDQLNGLCNGTRLQVMRMADHCIEARIISGKFSGNRTYIPRMKLIPSDKRIPFKFQRRQFPVSVCFAMTINKSQGQSLAKVALFLCKQVFTHGQLYVALSRVTSKAGLKALILDDDGNVTNTAKNVVYKEVLQRI